jgi:hypothetical protein
MPVASGNPIESWIVTLACIRHSCMHAVLSKQELPLKSSHTVRLHMGWAAVAKLC